MGIPQALWILGLVVGWSSLSPAFAQPPSPENAPSLVHVARYEGIINPVAEEYMTWAIEKSLESGASVLVFQLDTPGGLDTSMRKIIKAIFSSQVPVVVYVAPSGARAASAGLFITLAAHVAAMAPGTNLGAAHPVAMGGQMDEEMKKKVENDAAAYIRSIAERRGRNADWAEEAVRKSVSLTAEEALQQKVIDLVAVGLGDLLKALEGWKVRLDTGREVTLHTRGATQKELPMGFRLRVLSLLSDPNVAYILMILGFYGLFFELANPGAIFPGVVGAICLILAFYAFQTLPVNYAGVLLILLGIILLLADLKVTSYGLLSLGGAVSMILGSLMLVDTDVPFLRISWSVILPMVVSTVLFFVVVLSMAIRAHRRLPVSGMEGMVGLHGEVEEALRPEGRVFVHGELWNARSEDGAPIPKGETVEVVALDHLTLIVRRVRRKEGS